MRVEGACWVGLLLLGTSWSLAQTPGNSSKTSGSCSPALTGNSNQVTINCTGLTGAKANQLIVLMNRMLAEHLDLKEVESRLDAMHADVQHIETAVNWQGALPPVDRKRLDRGQELAKDCTDMVQRSTDERSVEQMSAVDAQQARTAAMQQQVQDYRQKVLEYTKATRDCMAQASAGTPCAQMPVAPIRPARPTRPGTDASGLHDSPELVAEFQTKIVPSLEAWRNSVAAAEPGMRYGTTSYRPEGGASVNMGRTCMAFYSLATEYEQRLHDRVLAKGR